MFGKSTLINKMSRKNSLQIGNKPGVTKSNQWVRIANNQELLDTPGVLWPKFDNKDISLNLSFIGSIKDEILDQTEIAIELLYKLMKDYDKNVLERYKISNEELQEIGDIKKENMYKLLNLIAKKTGSISQGGNIDEEKVSRILINDFRTCKIGKITLERI